MSKFLHDAAAAAAADDDARAVTIPRRFFRRAKNDAACNFTNKTSKMVRKGNINESHVIYVDLYINISVVILLRKP